MHPAMPSQMGQEASQRSFARPSMNASRRLPHATRVSARRGRTFHPGRRAVTRCLVTEGVSAMRIRASFLGIIFVALQGCGKQEVKTGPCKDSPQKACMEVDRLEL